jgi:hypothetical protein
MSAVAAAFSSFGSAASVAPAASVAALSMVDSDPTSPLQQTAEPQPLGHRDQHAGTGIVQNAGLAASIVLDLGPLQWRVDRHRHRADVEDPKERSEELDAGRQHECDPVARHDVAFDQAGCDRARRLG